ncbi:MAG TPA: hypothetical protein VMB52_06280 [Verrucomicrobiae bacterium]|nr:hypothetical protein [Verrucomicrobiae bacterium]
MIKNETYIGQHHYYKSESVISRHPMAKSQKKYKHRHTIKGSRKTRPRDEWIMVEVPKIIEPELFEKAKVQIKNNGKFSQRCKRNPYLFGSLIYCPCGCSRTGEGQNGHFYYRCTDRLLKFPKPRTCFEPSVNVQVLDAIGWTKLTQLLTNPQLLQEQLDRYAEEKRARLGRSPKKEEVQTALKSLEQEERRYVKAWGQGTMSENVYTDQMNSVARRRKDYVDQLNRPEEDDLDKLSKINLNELVGPFERFLADLSYEDKLFTVRKIVDKVIATKKEVIICGNIPLFAQSLSLNEVGLNVKYSNRRLAKRR